MAHPLLTPARRAAMLADYPTTTNAELSKRYGLCDRQLTYIAAKAGVHKDAAALRATFTSPIAHAQLAALRAALARLGADGLDWGAACALLPGQREEIVSTRLRHLVDAGEAHRAGPHRHTRWFADAQHAKAYATRPAPPTAKALRSQAAAEARAARTAARQSRLGHTPKPRAKRQASESQVAGVTVAPARGPAQQPGAPRITDATKITRAAPAPCRWSAGGAEPIFSAARPGQYDAEASSWVRAITGSRP